MEITEVRVSPRDEDRLKAFVTVTFDDCFVVRGVKIIVGQEGLFVAMPSRRRQDGQFQDIAHPIHSEMRQRLEDAVLAAYDEALGEDDGVVAGGADRRAYAG